MDPCALDNLAYIKSLDFVPLGKMRKEQSGDANETEKVAMRSVLGALGYLARESCQDLFHFFSHCLFVGFLWIQSVLCLTGMPVVGRTC